MDKSEENHINAQIRKSDVGFDDAQLLAENKRWSGCMNRLYYSSFYLAEALLRKNGILTKTHNGTKAQFNLHFIKPGLLSKEKGKLYSQLFDRRQKADYEDIVEYDERSVLTLLEQTKDLNEHLKKLINDK